MDSLESYRENILRKCKCLHVTIKFVLLGCLIMYLKMFLGKKIPVDQTLGKEFWYYNIEQSWTSICTTIFQKRYFIIPSHNVLMCRGHLKSPWLTNLSNFWCLVLEIQTASSQSKQSKHDKVRRIANVTFVLIQQICLEKGGIMEFISKANTVYGLPVINSLEVLTKALPGINKHSFVC